MRALVNDPQVTSVNRLPMRSSGWLCDSVDQARLAGDKPLNSQTQSSSWQISLDGSWQFRLLDKPEDLTAELLTGSTAAADWHSIQVPGAWTLQGPDSSIGDGRQAFEAPHYTNVIMPFDADPPAFWPRLPSLRLPACAARVTLTTWTAIKS